MSDTLSLPRNMVDLTCAYCGARFFRRRNQWVTKLRSGQTDFYCKRSCASAHFGNGRPKRKDAV